MPNITVEEKLCTYTRSPQTTGTPITTTPQSRRRRTNWRQWRLWAAIDAAVEKKKTDLSDLFK